MAAGEIAIMLLDLLVELKKTNAPYSFDAYARYWKAQIDGGYGSCNFMSVGRDAKGCPPGMKPGYINGGSRRTLQALQQSPSATGEHRKALAADVNCLVAATHFLPLFLTITDEESLVHEAKQTVYLSHKNADPVAAAEFLARALYRIIHHDTPLERALIEAAAKTNHPPLNKWLRDAQAKVAEVLDPTSSLSKEEFVDDLAITSISRLWDVGKSEPIKIGKFNRNDHTLLCICAAACVVPHRSERHTGKASPTEGALPSSIYFALKYQNDLEAALIANANCGGDSAARGIVIGMLLGSSNKIPADHRWRAGLTALPHVQEQLDFLSASLSPSSEL